MCAPACVCTALLVHRQTTPCFGSLRSTQGPTPAPPSNNKTPAVAIELLLCAPPCVCTALPVHRQTTPCFSSLHSTQGPAPTPPLNIKTPAVAIVRLMCAPPCVCAALCMHRLVGGSPNPNPHPNAIRVEGGAIFKKKRGGGGNGLKRTFGRPIGQPMVRCVPNPCPVKSVGPQTRA